MKAIFIAASSYENIDDKYFALSKKVANLCIKKELSLVFGASPLGMMGRLYNEYKSNNMKIEAVTIKEYESDLEHISCDKIIFDTTLKQIDYFMKCDILLFLPGGLGTLNEFINSITSKRNSEINSKIILFNYNGYYNNLLELLNRFEKEGFSKKDNLFTIVNSLEELEKEL